MLVCDWTTSLLTFTSDFTLSPTPQTEKSLRQCDILGRWLSITSKPVFVSVIEDDEWATAPHLRRKADTLKREPYDLMLRDCPYPSPLGVESVGDFALRSFLGWATRFISPRSVRFPDATLFFPATSWRTSEVQSLQTYCLRMN